MDGDKCATIVGQDTRQEKIGINARGLASRLSRHFQSVTPNQRKWLARGKIGIGNGFGEHCSRRNVATGRQPVV